MPLILLYFHGWGFDSGLWQSLAEQLPGFQHAFADRGYFGAPSDPAPNTPCIAVTHSFGAMRLLADPPPRCRGLVAINGFDRFTAAPGVPGVPPRVVERMLSRFAEAPGAVLADFRARCGAGAPPAAIDAARLREDLTTLRDADLTGASARWTAPILSLQGAADPILPAAMRAAAFAAAPQVLRETRPAAGHLLPRTDSAYCARAIAAFVEQTG